MPNKATDPTAANKNFFIVVSIPKRVFEIYFQTVRLKLRDLLEMPVTLRQQSVFQNWQTHDQTKDAWAPECPLWVRGGS